MPRPVEERLSLENPCKDVFASLDWETRTVNLEARLERLERQLAALQQHLIKGSEALRKAGEVEPRPRGRLPR
jgi:hypothetical protein